MKRIILSICIAALVTPALPAQVTGWSPGQSYTSGGGSQKRCTNSGKPLKEIKSDLQRRYGGKMLDTGYTNGQCDTLRITWETGQGSRITLMVDAQTGRVKQEIRSR